MGAYYVPDQVLAAKEEAVKANKERKQKHFRITLPRGTAKLGFSLYLGKKEFFLGITVGDVVEEQIIKKRSLKLPDSGVKVLTLDY